MKTINALFSLSLFTVALVATQNADAAVPVVNNATMAQSDTSRQVTITYTLANAPAVVTLDVETNCVVNGETVWASIGGQAVCNAKGDVWQKVTGDGTHTITWRPDKSWPDHVIGEGGARAVVTAWAMDNTPDYMVVDISAAAQPDTQKYYPTTDFLPGGLLDNDNYRKTSLVMRKIMAKDVEWTMGSTTLETRRNAAREATHKVTLTDNYYIGVFPVTQAQWEILQPTYLAPSHFNNAEDRAMRPVEKVSYNEIRNSSTMVANTTYEYPADPNPDSYLGKLRTRTGLDFDLPSEAQWEFAARAGNGDTRWGDGSGILNTDEDANLNRLGRYKANGGYVGGTSEPAQACDADNGTSVVGTYAPNAWGLYDTFGNVWEWCLDCFAANITANGGAVNTVADSPVNTATGQSGQQRSFRGGSWLSSANDCRPAVRSYNPGSWSGKYVGFRLCCNAGLQ